MSFRRLSSTLVLLLIVNLTLTTVPAQTKKASTSKAPAKASTTNGGINSIQAEDMQQWLTYLSSDELEGRNTFSEGLGLAAAYIADHLHEWNVKPGGDNGSYFQRVKVLGVKSTNHSSVTVEVNGQSKTFKTGEEVSFPLNVGGKRSFTSDQIEFMGYGLDMPSANHNDYKGKDVTDKVVVWLGPQGPKGIDPQTGRRTLGGRARYATDQMHALASIGQAATRPAGQGRQGAQGAPQGQAGAQQGQGGQGGRGGFGQIPTPDFTTVQRLDSHQAPTVTARDEFLDFLFSNAQVKYTELKEKADKQESLPIFSLKGVKITFNIDADYEIVQTQYTRNVVG